MYRYLVALSVLLGTATVQAGVVTVPEGIEKLALQANLEWLDEPGRQLTIHEVSDPAAGFDFQPLNKRANLGIYANPVWIRIGLDLPDSENGFLLELQYTQLDYVQAYWQDGGEWVEHHLGDRLPFAMRNEPMPQPVFRLPDKVGQLDVYFRVQTSGSMQFPLVLWNQRTYEYQNLRNQFKDGLIYAVVGTMLFYNLFLFFAVRDAVYLYLVGYMTGLLGFQMTFSGHAAMYLWPNATIWASSVSLFTVAICLFFGCLFVREMVGGKQVVPSASPVFLVLAGLSLVPILLIPIDYTLAVRMFVPLALVFFIYLPWPIGFAFFRGYRPSRFIVLGFVLIAPGAVVLILRYLELAPANFWTDNSLKIGAAVEAVFFSFALADRLNFMREDKEREEARRIQVERESALATIRARDEERERIHSDLHDDLGAQLLTLVHIAPDQRCREEAQKALQNLSAIVEVLDAEGCTLKQAASEWHAETEQRLKMAGIAFDWRAPEFADRYLSAEQRIDLARVMRELISNIIKYADASRVTVTLEPDDHTLRITISDNGKGMSLADDGTPQNKGHGSQTVRTRLKRMAGEALWQSQPGQGVTTILQIPLDFETQPA